MEYHLLYHSSDENVVCGIRTDFVFLHKNAQAFEALPEQSRCIQCDKQHQINQAKTVHDG